MTQSSSQYDFFTVAQPQPESGYINRLEHALLVVMTSTYALMHDNPDPRQVYPEDVRLAARDRLEAFFNAVARLVERGDFGSKSAAYAFVNLVFQPMTIRIRVQISELRYGNTVEQALHSVMRKLLNGVMRQPLDEIAENTGYGLLTTVWHIQGGDLSNSALSRNKRSEIATILVNHAENDRDEVEEILQSNGYHSCSDCCNYAHEDLMRTPYDSTDNVCDSCIDNNYRYSEHYSEYVYTDSGRWALDRDGDEVYVHEDDDDFHWDDDEDAYIHYEYEGRKPQLLGSYHNRSRVGKQPFLHSVWTQRNDRFMGVELEVEVKDGSIDDHVEVLNAKLNDGEVGKRVYFEADGSLTHGFEIITNPMGLDSHYELWSALNDRDLTRGMRSHDTSTCGLHVHVSRKNMHVMQLNKMNVFLNHPDNHELIKAVARRYDVNYARIARKRLSTAHKYDVERRDALNITNDQTVEFRIFKGTLVYDTLLSAIEFANAVVNFTMPASPAGFHLSTPRFLDFIDSSSQRSETKHLRKHLKLQGIMS
jgi:hypothetical protein